MYYKDYKKQGIGYSDIASLIMEGVRDGELKLERLLFGGDNSYDAYIVDDEAEIPEHYSKVAEFDKWFRLYDDERRVMNVHADKINVYRAGEYGCIIQIIDNIRRKEMIKMTIKEVKEMYKGEYADVEVYKTDEVGDHYPRHFHTDNCKAIDDYMEEAEVGLYELMDEEEYNNSILANTSERADFADWYDDKEAKVLCIMLRNE